MLEPFAFDYAQMVFVATLGVIQLVAARNNLLGILLLRNHLILTQFIATVLISGSLVWFFFGGEPRNIPDTGPGLEANTQTIVFASSASLAIALIFFVSSILNHRWGSNYMKISGSNKNDNVDGISAFQKTTFFWATVKFLFRI